MVKLELNLLIFIDNLSSSEYQFENRDVQFLTSQNFIPDGERYVNKIECEQIHLRILEKIRRDMKIFKLNRFCSPRKLRFIVQQINQKNQMQLNIQRDLSIMDYPKSPTPINKMPLISPKQAAVHSNYKPNIERNRSPSQMQRDSIN